jgi:hypothetical protein
MALCEIYNDVCVDVCSAAASAATAHKASLVAYAVMARALGLVLELGHGHLESVQVCVCGWEGARALGERGGVCVVVGGVRGGGGCDH